MVPSPSQPRERSAQQQGSDRLRNTVNRPVSRALPLYLVPTVVNLLWRQCILHLLHLPYVMGPYPAKLPRHVYCATCAFLLLAPKLRLPWRAGAK
jgi:hypothetical protein